MHPDLSSFYLGKPEPVKSCLLALREIILQFDREIKECKKYGMPCYLYNNKPLCYIWTDKKSGNPYLLIVEGKQIDHPSLEVGDRSRMKILPTNPNLDLEIDLIYEVLDMAKALA